MRISRSGGGSTTCITKTATPMDATDILLQFNEHNLHSELVTQDVLILTGAKDHFIPLKMHDKQVSALRNASRCPPASLLQRTMLRTTARSGISGLHLRYWKDGWRGNLNEQGCRLFLTFRVIFLFLMTKNKECCTLVIKLGLYTILSGLT